MKPLFDLVKIKRPKGNMFDLSHEFKFTGDMGDLIPILVQEIVPGDKFRVNTEVLMRLAPILAPLMQRINLYVHFFFVPWRLVYSNWEKFITGGEDGLDASIFPVISKETQGSPYDGPGTLCDYFGLPSVSVTGQTDPITVSALPFRAYQMIYNEYYRDQNLESKVDFSIGDGPVAEDVQLMGLRKRAWEKDYFTSCLPWAQRGGEVNLPMTPDYKDKATVFADSGHTPYTGHAGSMSIDNEGDVRAGDVNTEVGIDNLEGMDITINELRRAFRLQEWMEKNARAGSRYVETILSHFGVKSSDARLQRPEYLGGGKQPVVISEVLQTSETGTTPQGNMAGHGISVGNTNQFTRFFEEHGVVMGILSVLPSTSYQQGVERMWTKFDRFDYYWPEFAHIGEQEVTKGELLWDTSLPADSNKALFGYQSRYAEYKFRSSRVAGDFKTSLNYWHQGRIFDSMPTLNEDFVKSDPSTRIFAVTSGYANKMYVQVYHNIKAIRRMPVFGTPTF